MSKKLGILLVSFILATSLVGCNDEPASQASTNSVSATNQAGEQQAATEPVKIISTFEGACQVQTQLAYLLGFYDEEGLVEGVDYEFIDAGGETGSALLATGKADVAIGLIAGMLQPLDNGLEAKAILGLHTGCITLVSTKDSGVNSTADLKGKKIGVTALSGSAHIAALRALNFEGLSGDDVEFVVYDKDTIQQALFNGAVDVIGLEDYKANILERDEGAKIIFNTGTDERLKYENCCVLFATNNAINTKSDTLTKICRAIQKASVWISQNPELAADIQYAQGYTVGDPEVNKQLLKVYQFPTQLSSLKEAVYRNFDDAKVLGLLKEDTDEAALAESSYTFLDGVPDGIDESQTITPPNDPNELTKVKE